MTAERLLELAANIVTRRDSFRIETQQAIEAANAAIKEIGDDDQAEQAIDELLFDFQERAAALTSEATEEQVAELIGSLNKLSSMFEVHLVEHKQAVFAIDKKIREAAEADLSGEEYAAAIEEFKAAAAEYVQE